MSVLPEGEQLRKAVKWISEQRTDNPDTPLGKLISDASLKFDLPPKDEEFLFRFMTTRDSDT